MIDTTTVIVNRATTSGSPRFEIDTKTGLAVSAAASGSGSRPPGMPVSVPRSQLYYWTRVWQDGVAVAHTAIANGEYVDFDSDDPTDIVRWLFEADDEDEG